MPSNYSTILTAHPKASATPMYHFTTFSKLTTQRKHKTATLDTGLTHYMTTTTHGTHQEPFPTFVDILNSNGSARAGCTEYRPSLCIF